MFNIDSIGAPLILIAFFIEFFIALRYQSEKRVVHDMLANFIIGMCILFTGLFMKGVALALYSVIYSYAFFRPEVSVWLWIAGFFSCDLVLYIFHFLGHKTRIFWAAHVTHHSSLHYNLSVGLRVNFIHTFYRFLFWAPLCLVGIPPWMILFFESVTTIWNVLIHTERIKKLGMLDLVFNTPSNHRVHHASNPEYLDKNFGGILIIYDRLFGTYTPERSKPVYGMTHNIYTHNPLTILLHEYVDLFKQLRQIRGWKRKTQFLFSPPGSGLSLEMKLH
ncbi:MAG TPA: sterol desaturase family protein [Flavisolibacter sp.]|nr:sterol desaturase family protein [Flavisolibacter sp.]